MGLLATQLMLGCHNDDSEEAVVTPMKVEVPSNLEQPANLVGNWQEAKGKQTIQLNADGACEIIAKVVLGSNVTKGEAKGFDSKTAAKWGTRGGKFYFTDMQNSTPLVYDWEMKGEKLKLSVSGTELIYTRTKK